MIKQFMHARSATRRRLRRLSGRPLTLSDRLTDEDRARIDAAEHEFVLRVEAEVRG